MSRIEKKVVTYVCDRCKFEQGGDEIRRDEQINCGPSSREFWVIAGPVPERGYFATLADAHMRPLKWLCPACKWALDQFLTGTPLAPPGTK